MNKKIFTVLALLIVITIITAVSAFDLGDIFGINKNETVTIKGIDFNILKVIKKILQIHLIKLRDI